MTQPISRYWWALVLRGFAAIIFGVLAFTWPGITLQVLVLFFGAYALVDGILSVAAAIRGRGHTENWWLFLLQGLLGIGLGVLTWLAPGATTVAILLYIAAWALVTGVLEIVAAIRLRHEIEGEFWLGLGGLLSIAFGLLVFAFPLAGALGLIWLIGSYAIAFGLCLIALGIRIRRGKTRSGAGGITGMMGRGTGTVPV
ncbi:MAG: HdeD family acid-resistance protein [Nannocystis sp.]|nr:HdeD family acid-resistance protein [Nannocystis sp.]MBA3545434.1 HdeD family acid-resistance protein [Nannocystis sp.]